jgi:hypothetical protein
MVHQDLFEGAISTRQTTTDVTDTPTKWRAASGKQQELLLAVREREDYKKSLQTGEVFLRKRKAARFG